IAQPGINTSQDIKMQMVDDNVGNLVRHNAVQNDGNEFGNGNVVTTPAEGNGNGINGNPIRCYNYRGEGHYASNCIVKSRKRDAAYLQQQLQITQEEEAGIQSTQEEFEFMATADAYEETERVKVNCTSKDTLQQASTSRIQSDNAFVYESDGSTKVLPFLPTDDPLERLNKAMALFRSAITSRYPPATIQEGKVDMGKALDVSLVVTKSSETESEKQDTSSRSGNDVDADNADIRPIYDEVTMVEVQLTTECNIFATRQQHTEQPEIITEGRVDQYTEQCQVKSHMLDSLLDNKDIMNFQVQSSRVENILLKKRRLPIFKKDFSEWKQWYCLET
ncbi:hypothetical protein Tco_1416964, partial [Tanacetum coccineum]